MEKMLILIAFLFSASGPDYKTLFGSEVRRTAESPTSCGITNVEMQNPGECDDNGTTNPFDDFFVADVFVEFTDPPLSGQLRIELGEDAMSGGGSLTVDVADVSSFGSHLFEGIRFKADGTLSEVPVSFSAEPFCRFVLSDGPGVASCSHLLPCEITDVTIDNVSVCNNNGSPGNAADDFFTARVSVSFFNPPTTGELRIEPGGDALPGGGATSVPVANLSNEFGHSFTGVRFKADGNLTVVEVAFTGTTGCSFTKNGPTIGSCSTASPCDIIDAEFSNIGSCDANGTPSDPSDDFFTANLSVEFVNPPATGNLQIEPGGDALPGGGATSVPVASLVGNTHTFTGVRFKADGNPTVAEVEFSSNTNCVFTKSGPTVGSCSTAPPCDIIDAQFSNIGTCNANGTPADPSDDFFTADLLVEFANPPATGDLLIEPGGDALPGGGATSVPVASLVGNTHTFTGVRFKADGNPTVAEVEFSSNTNCVFTKSGPTIGSCSVPVVCDLSITNISTSSETCPNANNGSIVITATTSTGPLTYAISGPVNQNNSTGVFTGLPDGVYAITVSDTGLSNCTESSSAAVAAGVDNLPPSVVCFNKTVLLDATGNYTFTSADVFNAAASGDNCGTVNLTNISPASIGCAQAGQTVPVTVTVNDGNGNTASCTAQITVQEGTSLPVGLSGDNVGNANGSNTFQPCSGSEFTLTASGFSTSSSDVLRLVSRQLCGNGEIIAHVVDAGGGGWAGITLRETKASGAKKVALKTQLSNNIRREIRSATNGAVNNLNFFRPQDTWLRLVRNGSNFSGYTSMDGLTWNFAFSTTISMTGCIIAGLFSESINANVVTTAIFDQVSILGSAVPFLAPDDEQIAFELPDFQVYPNPTTGELSLDLSAFRSQKVALEIHNMQGQCLKVFSFNPMENATQRLNLSAFQNGIYLITAKSEGWPTIVKRIVLMDE